MIWFLKKIKTTIAIWRKNQTLENWQVFTMNVEFESVTFDGILLLSLKCQLYVLFSQNMTLEKLLITKLLTKKKRLYN